MVVLDKDPIPGITQLRIGTAVFLGLSASIRPVAIEGFHRDTFVLNAEVIELKGRVLDISGNAAPEDGKKEGTRLKNSCRYNTMDYEMPRIERRISGRFVMIPSTPIPIKRCISFRESGVHTNTLIPKLCAS